jgi:hypothetical protein
MVQNALKLALLLQKSKKLGSQTLLKFANV